MEIFTSYFYQIRFFKPNMIPLSTAVWDPKWYHDGQKQDHTFIDKNGVINGLRVEALSPIGGCENLCRGPSGCTQVPSTCEFLKAYKAKLDKIDKDDYMRRIGNLCRKVQEQLGFTEDPIPVLIVHEAPSNICSERGVLQKWAGCKELDYPLR